MTSHSFVQLQKTLEINIRKVSFTRPVILLRILIFPGYDFQGGITVDPSLE